MKTTFKTNQLPFLFLVLISFLSSSLAFSLSFSGAQSKTPSVQEAQITDNDDDTLSEALSRAFPSLPDDNPTYAAALAVFRELESKTTCHRSAAASLVSDCSAIEGKNDIIKVNYAAQLAICEFEATGIKFPRECQGTPGSPLQESRVKACVKKLEERPQWWTTLSNNIQSASVMCSAVKHEVEKHEILVIHRNITNAHGSLMTLVSTYVQQGWEAIEAQKKFKALWRTAFDDVLGDIAKTGEAFMSVLKGAEINAIGTIRNLSQEAQTKSEEQMQMVSELYQSILRAANGLVNLEEQSGKITEVVETAIVDLSTGIDNQRGAIERNSDLVQQANYWLHNDFTPAVHSLAAKIDDSSKKIESLADAFESHSSSLDSITSFYTELAKNHVILSNSFNSMEETQKRIISQSEKAQIQANIRLEHLSKVVENLTQILDKTGINIHSWRVNGSNWSGLSIGAVLFVFGALIRGWEKVVFVSSGILAVVLFIGFAQAQIAGRWFLGMFGRKVFDKLAFEVGPFVGEGLDNKAPTLSSSNWLWFGCFIVITMLMAVCGMLFFFLYRLRFKTRVGDIG